MAKYVCDFDAVRDAGEKLATTASEMQSSIDTYSTTIEGDLEGWESASKTSYMAANEEQKAKAKSVNEYATKMSEYVIMVADKIEDLENELASINI